MKETLEVEHKQFRPYVKYQLSIPVKLLELSQSFERREGYREERPKFLLWNCNVLKALPTITLPAPTLNRYNYIVIYNSALHWMAWFVNDFILNFCDIGLKRVRCYIQLAFLCEINVIYHCNVKREQTILLPALFHNVLKRDPRLIFCYNLGLVAMHLSKAKMAVGVQIV